MVARPHQDAAVRRRSQRRHGCQNGEHCSNRRSLTRTVTSHDQPQNNRQQDETDPVGTSTTATARRLHTGKTTVQRRWPLSLAQNRRPLHIPGPFATTCMGPCPTMVNNNRCLASRPYQWTTPSTLNLLRHSPPRSCHTKVSGVPLPCRAAHRPYSTISPLCNPKSSAQKPFLRYQTSSTTHRPLGHWVRPAALLPARPVSSPHLRGVYR